MPNDPIRETTPWENASTEPLSVIESNECRYHDYELATKRFRRVFNELRQRDAEIARLRKALRFIASECANGIATGATEVNFERVALRAAAYAAGVLNNDE